MSIIDATAMIFVAFNVLRLASYIPQIIAVARDRNRATAISISCWSIWICANASTAVYTWINLAHWGLTISSSLNAACCVIVVVISMHKRSKPGSNWLASRLGLRVEG